MKKRIKVLVLSLVLILLLNTVLFSVLTFVQAPYYDEAPSKMDSIYELYASDEYSEVVYRSALEYVSDQTEIQKINDVFKSASINKLNKFQSYFKMFSLGKKDFVFITFTRDYGDRKVAAEKLMASNIIVYLENNNAYVACLELKEYAYDGSDTKVAIYEVENESAELISLLKEYKENKKTGWQPILPEWRENISDFPDSFNGRQYFLFFFIEIIVIIALINKIVKKKEQLR